MCGENTQILVKCSSPISIPQIDEMSTRICQLLIVAGILYQSSLADIPNCVFEDTVALTDSTKFANGSYFYEGLLVPPHLTAEYDYIELFEGARKPVERHMRGCVCKIKQCVKFCCHPRADMYQTSTDATPQCEEVLNKELKYSPLLNITLRNSSRVVMHLLDEFVVQQGIPCEGGYMLMPHMYEEDQWELFENGTLLRISDAQYFSRRDYCLQAYNTSEEFVLNPMNCPTVYEEPPTLMLNTIIMLISAPFLYITILIYWLVPELWNLHTKCLISYLHSLAIGTTLIVVVNMQNSIYETLACAIIGFVAYFFLTAVFFWLNVICFDLWQNFRITQGAVRNLTQRKRFLYYSLYAWGMPALMTIITASLQNSKLPHGLKSGIGDTHCWLKIDDWSAMIYFHGPCLLLIVFNIGIFFLTANKIYEVRKELRHFSRGDSSQRHLRSQQNNVWLFFRMFIVMGIGWLLEIISYMVGNNSKYALLFAATDVYNASQGLIIFVLLVVKKKVLMLIKKRFIKSDNTSQLSTQRFTKSSTSGMELSNAESRWKLRT
nr:G-protein coupled receptor Mth2-like isoform X5 [Bactrocera oleae]